MGASRQPPLPPALKPAPSHLRTNPARANGGLPLFQRPAWVSALMADDEEDDRDLTRDALQKNQLTGELRWVEGLEVGGLE